MYNQTSSDDKSAVVVNMNTDQLKVVFSRTYKSNTVIRSAAEVYDLIFPYFREEMDFRESFRIVLLDRSNTVLDVYTVSAGGITECIVDSRVIFSVALATLATAIILVHNHPSGKLEASQADLRATKELVAAGKILNIEVLDHLILGGDSFLSLKTENLF